MEMLIKEPYTCWNGRRLNSLPLKVAFWGKFGPVEAYYWCKVRLFSLRLKPSQATLKLFKGRWNFIIQQKDLILDNIVCNIGDGQRLFLGTIFGLALPPLRMFFLDYMLLSFTKAPALLMFGLIRLWWDLHLRRHLTENGIIKWSTYLQLFSPFKSPDGGWMEMAHGFKRIDSCVYPMNFLLVVSPI